MSKLLTIIILFALISSLFANRRADRMESDGFCLEGPDNVRPGEPIEWTVTVTNHLSVTSRIDIASSVDAISYSGEILHELCRNVTTNYVAPFAAESFSFALNSAWMPTNAFPFDSVEIMIGVSHRTESSFSAGWIRPRFHSETNVTHSTP